MKFLFGCVLHMLCWVAEIVLLHRPFNMPVPVLMLITALLWCLSLVLIVAHIHEFWEWYKWFHSPVPDAATIARQLSDEDEERRQREWKEMTIVRKDDP